jgi:dCTP deaminase
MLLSDVDLEWEMDRGFIQIVGQLGKPQQASIDLTLAWAIYEPRRDHMKIDPTGNSKAWNQMFTRRVDVGKNDAYELAPGKYIIGYTYEAVHVPSNLAARVEGKSGLARLGLTIHNTAPHIGPGFKAHIALEIFNHSPATIVLRPRQLAICQIFFEKLSQACERPYAGAMLTEFPDRSFQNPGDETKVTDPYPPPVKALQG